MIDVVIYRESVRYVNFRGGVGIKKRKMVAKKSAQIFGRPKKKQYLCAQILFARVRVTRDYIRSVRENG